MDVYKLRDNEIFAIAWRYKLGFDYKTIPSWVFDLIVNFHLGYHDALEASANTSGQTFQLYDGFCWSTVFPGEWIVRYCNGIVTAVTNETFKTVFEQII